ncbi:MAG: hypothetical protein ABI333_26530 [bacterium]
MIRALNVTLPLACLLALAAVSGCGPSMQNTVTMGCGETQTTSITSHKCVVITSSEGACAVRATVKCEGQSEKSTVVRGSDNEGRLCCSSNIGRVHFSTVGSTSGKCKFTYGRD